MIGVVKDEARKLTTSTTPTFLGLTGAGGFYNTTGTSGEGIVIGIIDSGIWPEHPSFAAGNGTGGGKGAERGYQKPQGWHGMCEAGEQFTVANCNRS